MNPLEPKEFRRQGHMIIDFLADYYQSITNYPVLSQVEPGYLRKLTPSFAPLNPEPIEAILQDLQQHIIPGITHWQSPNYFAYFPSSGSTAGFVGEMLSTGFNLVGFNWVSSPAATELENTVMDWLGQVLKLPKTFLFSGSGGGVLLGTTCEAILVTLVAARDKILSQIGIENIGKLVVYVSDQTHCAIQKAAHIVGIHSKNFRVINTMKSTSFALMPEPLLSAIHTDVQNGLVPCYLCVTVGTTSTTAIDPLGLLCKVANKYGMWVHVDAAYAGSVCICPEFRHLIDGVEGATSFSFNAHKWFLTNLDCCCLWVKDQASVINSLSTHSVYLENNASDLKQVVDYKDWQITLSRRFRALKVWLVLRSYGVANLRDFLRSHVEMAKNFEELVRKDKRFEIFVPRNVAVVCFRLLPSAVAKIGNGRVQDGHVTTEDVANEINRKLLDSINGSGTVYMTHATVGGVFVIRCAIGATLTEKTHVIMAWKVVQEHADAILNH
ncbi:hypothetical protein VNO78_04437 [Psophocarpus tetragonolobus]|uniref:Tyrosine decarboxylase n=1 Tax=Psophocarpus tetragonolobus TaxID=3891 RepID=A0AAN9XWM7_PSOTE